MERFVFDGCFVWTVGCGADSFGREVEFFTAGGMNGVLRFERTGVTVAGVVLFDTVALGR